MRIDDPSQIKNLSGEKRAERRERRHISSFFGEDTFNKRVMQAKLPRAVYLKLMSCIDENSKLDIDTANAVAHAMKEWAMENGATHFAHWFQPMTESTAEKHDAFIEFLESNEVIERFSGLQLVQGEPDASNFPSGGIRATFEARGYTAWDMSSPAFLRKNGLGITLCIPSAYISYTGEALDNKTPLLRSLRSINKSAMRMLRILGNNTSKKVISYLGPEQEYFLIDRNYYKKRQDLVLTGRTLLGAAPPKGQELENQYFGSIKERIQSFMHDFEEELFKLGIPAKTRHNEAAPAQFEIAPIFEEANLAVDHNLLLMDTMRKVVKWHNLVALLHEKPFAGVNGSGKHINWSLGTDDGINLIYPGKTPSENIQFLVFLTAVIKAVHRHGDLLRATVATIGNEHRLGSGEAPPAIISVFLGEHLENILSAIETGEIVKNIGATLIDLDISALPIVNKDNNDRNRTSPFAFTGNKFEFRAAGSSQSISLPATVINMIVAESLDELSDKIEKSKHDDPTKAIMNVLRDEIKEIRPVIFGGDNYSHGWQREAEKRGLPNFKTSPKALKSLNTEKAERLFEKYKILTGVELHSRYQIYLENYIKKSEIESRTFCSMVSSQIIPAAYKFQNDIASSIKNTQGLVDDDILKPQKDMLKNVSTLIGKMHEGLSKQQSLCDSAKGVSDELQKAEFFCSSVKAAMEELRQVVDELEMIMDDSLYPLPKLWEMLFIV